MKLKNKVALITGASSGIGQAAAIDMAKEGAKVVIGYYHNEEGAKKTLKSIEDIKGKGILIKADVTVKEQVEELVLRTINEFGPIDILVNNAGGIIERSPIAEITDKLWDDMMDLNFRSAFLCVRAVLPDMEKRKTGSIVNLSSTAAQGGIGFGAVPYGASKGGVEGFTLALATELVSKGIRVNAVTPGTIDTPFYKNTPREVFIPMTKKAPMGRIGKPEEVAKVITFLASDDASYITGSVFKVAGGE